MNRKLPKDLPPDVTKQSGASERIMKLGKEETRVIVQTRQYTLITPLFGGGVEPHKNDLDNLIRSTEIRGQLRFWWRAIRGGQSEFEGDPQKMKAREDEIWGAASNINKPKDDDSKSSGGDGDKKKIRKEVVQIEVEVTKKGQAVKPFKLVLGKDRYKAEPDNDIPGYAAFPLRPDDEKLKHMGAQTPIVDLQQNVEFDLKITFREEWTQDILAALWAWETFGGVGARTRRGFGALLLRAIDASGVKDSELPPSNPDEVKAWIRGKFLQYLETHEEKTIPHVPHIGSALNMRILGPFPQSTNAWRRLIDSLFTFRQQRFDFRQQRPSLFGKSLWPEANALRQYLHENQPKNTTPGKFPRAAFGLPIVFHLPHERPVASITLQGTKDAGERFASRLILKPMPCRDKKFLGIAIVLDGSHWPEEDLVLMRNGKPWKTIPVEQTQLKSRELPNLDHVLGAENDVLKAFMNYLKPEEK